MINTGIAGIAYYKIPDEIDIPNIQDAIIKKAMQQEDEILIKALTDYLGRPPVEQDFKDCTMAIFPGHDNEYDLFYQGINVGHCIRGWSKFGWQTGNPEYKVTFYPAK